MHWWCYTKHDKLIDHHHWPCPESRMMILFSLNWLHEMMMMVKWILSVLVVDSRGQSTRNRVSNVWTLVTVCVNIQSECCLLKSQDGWYFLFLSPQYESKKRISAEEAMKHSYFRQLGIRVYTLPESEHAQLIDTLLGFLRFISCCLLEAEALLCVVRCIDIHAKGSAAAARPRLQELLVPWVWWAMTCSNTIWWCDTSMR